MKKLLKSEFVGSVNSAQSQDPLVCTEMSKITTQQCMNNALVP